MLVRGVAEFPSRLKLEIEAGVAAEELATDPRNRAEERRLAAGSGIGLPDLFRPLWERDVAAAEELPTDPRSRAAERRDVVAWGVTVMVSSGSTFLRRAAVGFVSETIIAG
jgi:nucleotide-binding universal stress UspA family protein